MKYVFSSILGFGGLVCLANGSDSLALKYAKTITKADLKQHLSILASDEYEGRETGLKGQKMAATYIENQFKNFGLIPKVNGNGYQQSFPITIEKPGSTVLQVNGKPLVFIDDYFYVGSFAEEIIQSNTVCFAGYGIETENYNDYIGLDVKGKIVFILDGYPTDKKDNNILSQSEIDAYSLDRLKKIKSAQEKGASAIFILTTGYTKRVGQFKSFILNPRIRLKKPNTVAKAKSLPTYYLNEELASNLFEKGVYSKAVSKIKKSKKPASYTANLAMRIDVKSDIQEGTSENVLGFVEGTDLKDELVVVTAHYDHIGMQGDKVFNGADDDGSGTSAVIEMAQAFAISKSEGKGPRRSMLFMTVSGEEKGLLGSEWYTDYPVWPLEKTVCDLNIDMIGRIDKQHTNGDYIYIIGSDKLSSELHFISENANKKFINIDLDYTYNAPNDPNRFYYRSDHYNFAKNNIPVIFYFNGVHEDYHQETDEVEKIDFDKMEKITRLVFYTAWDVANRDKKLIVDKTNDFKN